MDLEKRGRLQSPRSRQTLTINPRCRFCSLLHSTNHAIISIDSRGKIVLWNAGARKAFGYKASEIMGKPLAKIMPKRLRSLFREGLKRAVSTGIVKFARESVEMTGLRKDGTEFPLELSISKCKARSGLYFTGLLRDVTKRKGVEDKLKLYADVVEEAPDGIQIVDLSGRVVYSNRAVTEIYGFLPREIEGKHVDEMNADPKFASEVIIPSLKEREHWSGELAVKHKDGHIFPVWLRTSIVKDEAGNPIAVMGVIRDMAELKKTEEALRKSEERYRLFINATSDLAFLKDEKLRYIVVNQAQKDYMGKNEAEVIGKTDFKILPRRVAKGARQSDLAALESKEMIVIEDQVDDKSYEVRKFRVGLENGKYGVGGYIRDITARRELEHRKDEFISIASHELKTPITSAKIFAQIIQKLIEQKKEKEAITYLGRMDEQLDRLTQLINDLLDVSKIQSGRLKLRLELFSLQKLVREIVEETQVADKTHKIIIKGQVKKKLWGDKNRIGEVLINLLSNAIKYSPRGKKVVVEIKPNSENVTVSVKDYGVGIDPKYQKKIFYPFYSVTESRSTSSGLGMGLYIVKEIVKMHGGELGLESEEGKGSTFYFSLPFSKPDAANTDNNYY